MRAFYRFAFAPLLLVVGCHESQPPTNGGEPAHVNSQKANAAPPSQQATKTYVDTVSGISFQYPINWTQGRGKTAVFEASSPDHLSKLSLDVPSLPFHLPGMITPSAVANGYINDFKKQSTNASVTQNESVNVQDSSARRVSISSNDGGKASTDLAVCIVHADKVYILSCDGSGTGVNAAKDALDAAVRSLRWSK